MKKLLSVLVWIYSAACLAQSYPSPVYNTVSVVGGSLGVTGQNPAISVSDTLPTGGSAEVLIKSGVTMWGLTNTQASNRFSIEKYIGGGYQDSPLYIDGGTGLIHIVDGLNANTIGVGGALTVGGALGVTGASTFAGTVTFNSSNVTFHGPPLISFPGAILGINDTSGTSNSMLIFANNGPFVWGLNNYSGSNALTIDRYVNGAFVDSPFRVDNAAGTITQAATAFRGSSSFANGFLSAGRTSVEYAGATFVMNDTSGTSQNTLAFQSGSNNEWQILTDTSQMRVTRYVGNSFVDNPLTIQNSSGAVAIKGTSTNDNAAVGYVGEFIKNHSVNTPVPDNTLTNCGTLSLPPGDWDVWGNIEFTPTEVTSWGQIGSSLSFVSNTLPGEEYQTTLSATINPGQPTTLQPVMQPLEIGSTTIVYLIGSADFSGGTMTCDGYLEARRRR